MRTDEFVTHRSPTQPGRILVASRTCGCRAIVGKFTACELHVDNIELEEAFLKRADEEQNNYDKGVLPRTLPTDAHDEPPKTPPVNPNMIQGGRDPWDAE